MTARTPVRSPCGSTFSGFQVSTSDASIAQVFRPCVAACEERVFPCRAIGRMIRSTGMLSISMQLTLRNKINSFQYLAMYLSASLVGGLVETCPRARSSHIVNIAIFGAVFVWRKVGRLSAILSRACASIWQRMAICLSPSLAMGVTLLWVSS